MSAPHLRSSGGYRELHGFGVTTLVYDATVAFCERWLDPRSRLADQMIQAARSGRQNIAEGSRAAAVSSQTELRLINVARASLDELLLDYEDYLRQRGHRAWAKDDPEALAVRALARQRDRADPSDRSDRSDRSDPIARFGRYAPWLANDDPAVVANAVICLIHQANYLLDRLIAALERQFIEEGGYTERLAAARLAERERQRQRDRADRPDRPAAPDCPRCGRPMVLRTARRGPHAGGQFWGCSAYPDCRATLPLDRSDPSD